MHLIKSTILGESNAKLDSNMAMPHSCDAVHTGLGSCCSHPHDSPTCCGDVLGMYPQKRQQKSPSKPPSCTIVMYSACRKTNREIGKAKSDLHLEPNDEGYADRHALGPTAITRRRTMQKCSSELSAASACKWPCMKSSFSFYRLRKAAEW